MPRASERPREKAWVGVSREGTITSCRRIQVQEAFLEEVVFELSLEGWIRIC